MTKTQKVHREKRSEESAPMVWRLELRPSRVNLILGRFNV
jgi:hypothetical protein